MQEQNGGTTNSPDHALAWLGRKIGWGFADGEFDEWIELGRSAVLDQLVDPDAAGIAERPDPFAEIDARSEGLARTIGLGVTGWIEAARTSPRPLETFMEFFWSDFFAVSLQVVRPPQWMFEHMRLLGRHALGNFAELLAEVTIDAAMLDFLDGRQSSAENVNENYGRELLELYSVGVGNFTEDDVVAASRALTGWRVRRATGTVQLVDRLHDDTPQVLLGRDDVNDVDSVIDAVLAHPATAPRIVDELAAAVLGPGHDTTSVGELGELATRFADDWELKPVVRSLLEMGLDGQRTPALIEPIAWYTTARKLPTVSASFRELRTFFTLGGQVPMMPPNVGGFPSPDTYLSTSATIARFNMAAHLSTRPGAARLGADPAAVTEDLDALAWRLGLVDGFAPATHVALAGLEPGADRLTAALASPDLVVA